MAKRIQIPAPAKELLLKRNTLKRELAEQANLVPVRIAILGGSTTVEIRSTLEVLLLADGIQPVFYESEYCRYAEDVWFANPELWNFRPEICYIHTTWQNVAEFPELLESEDGVAARARREEERFESLWDKIRRELGAVIIQNNFDLPALRPLGNLEASVPSGRIQFLTRLNAEFAAYAQRHSDFILNDICYLAAQMGLSSWFDPAYWHNFRMAVSPAGTVALARSVAAIIKAIYGKNKKCLVLDLDNTLWGGVIGDDGLQNLVLGRDHPQGEAYLDFQRYVKELKGRGIILAVCSKNDAETAKEGFVHPDSVLKLEDFSAFKANWNTKPENLREIAAELNIGLDSMVFVDDNPAERAIVMEQLPEVSVPELGANVSSYAEALERERYFEVNRLVAEDLSRAAYYSLNAQREAAAGSFQEYGDFLDSLEMTAEIGLFNPLYLERITQLINKTNQFNLTTRRYASAEVEAIGRSPLHVGIYGRLADRFGDNGLVSLVIGRISGETLEVDLWAMSCRVLKREMELSMFDALVEECLARGVRKIIGVYVPSKKNRMVEGHYAGLGFQRVESNADGRTQWEYELSRSYVPKSLHIRKLGNVYCEAANG